MRSSARVFLCFVIASQCFLSIACSTQRLLKKQKLQVLTDEYRYMGDVDRLLTSTPNPEVLSHTSVFISKGTIDKILSAADNVHVPIPQISGATFHVDTVRSDFRDNFPIVNIKCWAEKENLRVDLNIYAEIEPILSTKDPSKMVLKIDVIRV